MQTKIEKLKQAIGKRRFNSLSKKNKSFMLEIVNIDGLHLDAIAEFVGDSPRDMKPFRLCKL